MSFRNGSRGVAGLLSIVCVVLLIAFAPKAIAGGVVASADQASLQNALNGGGTVTFSVSGTIVLTNTITIAQNTVLDASGQNVTIDGGGAVQLFYVNSTVNFTIVNLGLARGTKIGTNGVGSFGVAATGESVYAGGIYNNTGTLTVLGCLFSTNSVVGGNGDATYGGGGGAAYGGAIYNNQGTVNITNSAFNYNRVTGGVVSPNGGGSSGSSFGGAIYSHLGLLNVDQTTLYQNLASGGSVNFAFYVFPGNGSGGAIFNDGSAMAIRHSIFLSNSANGLGGAHLSSNAGTGAGGALFNSSGSLAVSDTTFSTNSATGGAGSPRYGNGGLGAGGAIYNFAAMSLARSSFLGNSCTGHGGNDGKGGAIFSSADFTSKDCFLAGNLALGGLNDSSYPSGSTLSGNGYGGGIYSSSGLVLWACTLSQNQARGGDYTYLGNARAGNGNGGALYNTGNLFVTDSTISLNTATGGSSSDSNTYGGDGNGGGILNSNGSVILTFVTISGNNAVRGTAPAPGSRIGGGVLNTNGTVNARNSIIANSQFGGNAFGALIDSGNNISSDATCNFTAPGSYNNADPLLGPLANNGGFTPTMALLSGSPAINAANPTYAVATDQRGITRPQGGASDIGAFELAPSRLPAIYSFSPTSGLAGTVVVISGTNFSLATQVSFNGVNANFTVDSDTQITATAPAGFTTGPITVTTFDGSVNSTNNFSTGGPAPTTGSALATASSANLNGTVFRDGTGGSAFFQYGTSSSYGNYGNNSSPHNLGSGTGLFPVNATVNGLNPNTAYHFRIVAQNSSVTNYGADQTFTTPLPNISVSTTAATSITNNSAMLNGQGNADGFSANVYFQYGPTTNLGGMTAGQSIGNGTSLVSFNTTVSGLIAGHVYYFRAVIVNAYATNYGSLLSFATTLSQGADYALSFDGLNDFVQVPDNSGLNVYPLTLTAWFRSTQKDGYVGIAGKYTNGSGNGYQISITDGSLHAFYYGANGSLFKLTNGLNGGLVNDGLWHQAGFTVDASGGRLYLDGALKDSVAWTGTPSACTTTATLKFGPYIDYLNGQLDEIALWNMALSGTQIQSGMTNRLTGAETNLIGYWRFEEGAGVIAGDSSGHGNDGTLVNGPAWVYSGTPLPKRIAATSSRQANGMIRFTLTGVPGQSFTLQSSTTLTNWTDVLTGTLGVDGTYPYLDTNSLVTPKRFLRTSQ